MAGVVRESIVDGPGLRMAVFCQGCPHGCPGCHNQETHDFAGGYDCEIEKIVQAVKADPLLVASLRGEPGFFPAYHMNRERWISVALDGSVPGETLGMLLAQSYAATAPKARAKARPAVGLCRFAG